MKHFDSMPRPNPIYFQPDQPILQLIYKGGSTLANAAFMAFVVLVLSTPAWRTGPFTWWPVWQSSVPDGGSPQDAAPIGLLSLLPMLCVLAWGAGALWARLARRQRTRPGEGALRARQWEAAAMIVPLLALSLLILRSLDPALNK